MKKCKTNYALCKLGWQFKNGNLDLKNQFSVAQLLETTLTKTSKNSSVCALK